MWGELLMIILKTFGILASLDIIILLLIFAHHKSQQRIAREEMATAQGLRNGIRREREQETWGDEDFFHKPRRFYDDFN